MEEIRVFLGRKRLLKTQVFEKKHSFQGIKKLRQFFSHYRTQKMSVNNIKRCTMFFNKYGAISMIFFFVGPKKSRTNYFKIKATVPKKKYFGPFFSYYPLLQTLGILLLGSTRYIGTFGASYKIISLGPKRLFKTHVFWKKAIFSVKKCICPIFFRIVEIDKSQKTIQKSQKDILIFNVEVIRSFWGPKRLLKTQTFEKNAVFQWTNVFAPFFLKLSSVTNFRKGFIRAEKIFWQLVWK